MSEIEKGILKEMLAAYAMGAEIFITDEGNKWLASRYLLEVATDSEMDEDVEAS